MELAMNLGRKFSPENLGIFYIHKMPQPHAQNFLFNHVLGYQKWPNYVHEFGGLDGKIPDWILWVEDDAAPPGDGYDLLRSKADPVKRPIMHCISFDRAPPHMPSISRLVEKDGKKIMTPIYDWKDDSVYEIFFSGTCFSLIHTSVFPKLRRPWFRMQPFEPGVQGIIPCTSLHERIREAGIPIHAYTGCVVTHMGEHVEVGADLSRRCHSEMQESI